MKGRIEQAERPAHWATRVQVGGVPNLHRVTPLFYRSAQPSKSGFAALPTVLGIKTIITMRAFHSDRKKIAGTPLELISIPINTWNIKQVDVVRTLAEIEVSGRRGPVLLHCLHGADRSGVITALFRRAYEGWTADAALDEMRNGHYGYHALWGNIPIFLAKIDIDALRSDIATEVASIEMRAAKRRVASHP